MAAMVAGALIAEQQPHGCATVMMGVVGPYSEEVTLFPRLVYLGVEERDTHVLARVAVGQEDGSAVEGSRFSLRQVRFVGWSCAFCRS